MSTQQKMLEKLNSDLKLKVIEYFDSIERFENQYILNTKIRKDSVFEKSEFCSSFTIYDLNQISTTDIMLGDCKEVTLTGEIKISTSSVMPKQGKELALLSSSIFGITIIAEVSFNQETKSIEVAKVDVRSK